MFRDRVHAGAVLGALLSGRCPAAPTVLGLPRGGVIVAAQVAAAIGAPLDVVVVRKLGAPANPELGIGAVAEGGVTVLNDELIARLGVGDGELAEVARREHIELERRTLAYRTGCALLPLEGMDAMLIDDGLATGYTARAAIEAVRQRGAATVTLAVPVAAAETAREMAALVDHLVCAEVPAVMLGVGAFYRDFGQTTDEEVMAALRRE